MRIAIGCDHAGFPAKKSLIDAVRADGHEPVDMGTDSTDSVDYPRFARRVAAAGATGTADRGVVICGSGIGVAVAANRIRGVRAAVCLDEDTARLARAHNDINVLSLPGRRLDDPRRVAILRAFLTSAFEGGRHAKRAALLDEGIPAYAASGRPGLVIPSHPLVTDRLTQMRARETPPHAFRDAMRSLAPFLVYEAARGLGTKPVEITTPLSPMRGARLAPRIVLFPILRAGLGLLDGALEVFPEAAVGLIGVYRDEKTLQPVLYHLSGPTDLSGAAVFILDPMLATGGSGVFATQKVKEMGAEAIRYVSVIAAPEGVDRMLEAHPDVPIVAAAIDPKLNEKAYIVPGLGDAGDRFFGT